MVTVTGPGKMVFLAGVGAEDEDKPQGAIRHLGNPYLQCKYAYDKMKRHLAKHGGTLADVVKQVVYVTDIRYQTDVGKCRREEYGERGPIPANTFLVISGLAIQGMLLEIDVPQWCRSKGNRFVSRGASNVGNLFEESLSTGPKQRRTAASFLRTSDSVGPTHPITSNFPFRLCYTSRGKIVYGASAVALALAISSALYL